MQYLGLQKFKLKIFSFRLPNQRKVILQKEDVKVRERMTEVSKPNVKEEESFISDSQDYLFHNISSQAE